MQTSQSKQKTHNQRYSLIYNLNYNRIVNFFINLLLLILLSIYVFIVTINIISYIAQYPTLNRCQIKSGIWDRDNSICGFLVIYGDNLELRKILLD